jgi:hypothetical protein
MRKLLLLVILALALPIAATAQNATEIEPSSIGEGWSLESSGRKGGLDRPWAHLTVYVGPAGSVITIEAHSLGEGLAGMSAQFISAHDAWRRGSAALHTPSLGTPEVVKVEWAELPPTVTDAMRVGGTDDVTGQPVGYGLYGSIDGRVVVIIRAVGAVNGLTGVPAADYVAGLYFAALME